jgi:erythromycin esterase-like protein
MRFVLALVLSLLACLPNAEAVVAPATLANAPFVDFGFESPGCEGGWRFHGVDFEMATVTGEAQSGQGSLRLHYAGRSPWQESGVSGIAEQPLPIAVALRRKVRLTGSIKTAGITTGQANLWLAANGIPIGGEAVAGSGARGTTPWTRYAIEVMVPGDTREIRYGAQLAGNGTAWFDSLELTIDGERYGAVAGPRSSPASAEAVAWLRRHALPLAAAAAAAAPSGAGDADLAALRQQIGDARIVALGEATHGTRESSQLENRIVEMLAHNGFTLFAIEANQPETARLNAYVETGEGDPRELLRGLATWSRNTQELLDLVQWMREWNRSGQGHMQLLGFDMQSSATAAAQVRDFVTRADPGYLDDLDAAYRTALMPGDGFPPRGTGVADHALPAVAAVAGKALRLRGWVKTREVSGGEAGLFVTAQGDGAKVKDESLARGATATADWQPLAVEIAVPEGSRGVNFGMYLRGLGTAWFDSLSLDVDGAPLPAAAAAELGLAFAGGRAPLADWYTAAPGYQVAVDESVAHGGGASLRIQRTALPGDLLTPAAAAADRAVRVLVHLLAERDLYRSKLGPRQAEQAIQDARIVLQAAQVRAGLRSRDEAMADNVDWLLQQAPPGAKIVLSGHNGHVGKGGEAMGSYLERRHGKDYFALGFTFGAGRYYAVRAGQGLVINDAPAAIPGSLETYLATAGLPRFLLDLRDLPRGGPAAPWLAEERPRRESEVQALSCDWQTDRVADLWDALAYFADTSPATLLP